MDETNYDIIIDANGKLLPEIKTLWLKALRSGDYPQGVGMLICTDERPTKSGGVVDVLCYCCLGVLGNELNACAKVAGRKDRIELNEAILPEEMTPVTASLNDQMNGINWNNIDSIRAFAKQFGFTQSTVSGLNDNMGWSFAKIADWIEEYY